jgi:hypothetical protein
MLGSPAADGACYCAGRIRRAGGDIDVEEHKAGSLACVGVGMMLGAHLTPRARSCIEQSDVVFVLVADALMEEWVRRMNPDVRSLQPFYREGMSRMRSYRGMVETMLVEVRAGKRVCGAFYGHPGVFAWVPHRAIAQARAAGHAGWMEPGISAEDCLYADLGVDPGTVGCQHYEATRFMLYRRRVDPAAWLVLWQIGVAGDRTLARRATGEAHRRVLVDLLEADYPPEHEVILYRAATLPTQQPLIRRMPLSQLPHTAVDPLDTLVVPPTETLLPDPLVVRRLAAVAEPPIPSGGAT